MYTRERYLKFKPGDFPGDHPIPMPPADVVRRFIEGCIPGYHVVQQIVQQDPMISTEFMVCELARNNPERLIELLPIVVHDLVSLRRLYKMLPGYVTRILAETKMYSNLQTADQVDTWLRTELELVTEEFAFNKVADAFSDLCVQVNPHRKDKLSDLFQLEMTREHIRVEAPKITSREKLLKEITPHLTIESALHSFQQRIDDRKAKCSDDRVKKRMEQDYVRLREATFAQKDKVTKILEKLATDQAVVDRNASTQHWPEVFQKYKKIYSMHQTAFPADPHVPIEPYLEPPPPVKRKAVVEEEEEEQEQDTGGGRGNGGRGNGARFQIRTNPFKKTKSEDDTNKPGLKVIIGMDLDKLFKVHNQQKIRDEEEETEGEGGPTTPATPSMALFSPPGVRFRPTFRASTRR